MAGQSPGAGRDEDRRGYRHGRADGEGDEPALTRACSPPSPLATQRSPGSSPAEWWASLSWWHWCGSSIRPGRRATNCCSLRMSRKGRTRGN